MKQIRSIIAGAMALALSVSLVFAQTNPGTSPLSIPKGGTGSSTAPNHLVIYRVAPSGASTLDKLRADFVGNGVSDQTAVNAAVTAARAISSYSKVEMLPGTYNFSAAANLGGAPGQNGFVFEARGTIVNGPGVGGAATALDTFSIQNSNFSEINFGSIKTNNIGTAAAIHSTGNFSETKITWQALDGTARSGYGFFADTTSAATSQSVNWITATHVQNFAKGIVLSSVGAGANVDTWRVTVDYIYNNVVGIYAHSATGGVLNSNFWNVNIDASAVAGDIAFQTNSSFDVVNGIIGGLAAGSHNIVLDSGATANIFNLTPISLAVTAGSILDNSANLTNVVNGSIIDGFLNGLNQLVKYDGATNGAVSRTGLALGTIGTANTIAFFSGTGVLASGSVIPSFGFASGSTLNWNLDTYIGRAGAAKLMLGQADAAAPVAQTLSVQNVVTGTSNTAGALLSIVGSQSTGTGLGGPISFKVAPPGGSGSTPNALVEVARLAPTAAGGSVWTQGAGMPFTPGAGAIAEWRTGTDQRFALGPKNSLATGVAFQAYNDAISANVGLEFRASLTALTVGGLSLTNGGSPPDPGVGALVASASIKSTGPNSGIGYATGAGGAVTQITSRSTGVTLNNVSGAITLFSATNAAVSLATAVTMTVTNSTVAATDTIVPSQKSGTDKYLIHVTNVSAGSFALTFFTTGGTATEAPVFNFAVIKAVAN